LNIASLTTNPAGFGSVGVVSPPQEPWLAHTPELPVLGTSFWVHHFADQLFPPCETVVPPKYTVEEFQAGAQVAAAAVDTGRTIAVAPTTAMAASVALIRCFNTRAPFAGDATQITKADWSKPVNLRKEHLPARM
jgi:hypothetical protein